LRERIETWLTVVLSRGGERAREYAFNRIWEKYSRRILFFIQNRAPGDAEDLTQEIMLKVFRNLDRFDPKYSFNTWIYSIARNHCINHLSRKRFVFNKPVRPDGEENRFVDPATPESDYLDRERRHVIDSILAGLDREDRETAFLKFFEGMKTREIADILKLPEGTVKSRIHGIRLRLKDGLEKYDEDR
jgi:RNA polymerase sigma-70 factor (ECF subfamily)